MPVSRAALIVAALLAAPAVARAEKAGTIDREAFVCVSWAAWHDDRQACQRLDEPATGRAPGVEPRSR